MQHLFIPYEMAIALKEKGYNEKCLAWYRILEGKPQLKYYNPNSPHINDTNKKLSTEYATAPLYQQVVDWFREKHKISITGPHYTYSNAVCFSGTHIPNDPIKGMPVYVQGKMNDDVKDLLNNAIIQALKLI